MEFIALLANISTVIAAILSVVVYRNTVNRERKILTVDHWKELRQKYSGGFPENDEERHQYLRDMEFFCVGINSGIYDIKIVKKMSGKLMLKQYEKSKIYIEEKIKEGKFTNRGWNEYLKVIDKLKKMYKL